MYTAIAVGGRLGSGVAKLALKLYVLWVCSYGLMLFNLVHLPRSLLSKHQGSLALHPIFKFNVVNFTGPLCIAGIVPHITVYLARGCRFDSKAAVAVLLIEAKDEKNPRV